MVRIIESSWLEENLKDPRIVIVDPRPFVKYLEGHIPGAVNLPLAKLLDPKTLALMPAELLSQASGAVGIDSTTRVVIYDGYDGQNAAMLAWILEHLGHPDVTLLSRRFLGWLHDEREVLYKPVVPKAKRFDARLDETVRARAEDLLQRGSSKVLDLRSRDEFQGRVATEARTGHIPAAINVPWTDLIGDGYEFLKPAPELTRTVASIGLSSRDKIVTYCTYGPRAALGYVALQHIGYENVRVYDGSFHQWSQNTRLPVEGEGLLLQV